MINRFSFGSFGALGFILAAFVSVGSAQAETHPLLAKAVSQWDAGQRDLAFTQHAKVFGDKDEVKETRVERYDPSLPDSQRWQLIEFNGKPATPEQREKWESKKNGKPRKKAIKSISEYLDLPNAKLKDEDDQSARFEIGLRSDAARLVAVEKLTVIITVEKEHADITHIAAMLQEPMKIALGLAKVTDLDFDLHVEPEAGDDSQNGGKVKPGSTAKVVVSKFGDPIEYRWSDFKRVNAHGSKS